MESGLKSARAHGVSREAGPFAVLCSGTSGFSRYPPTRFAIIYYTAQNAYIRAWFAVGGCPCLFCATRFADACTRCSLFDIVVLVAVLAGRRYVVLLWPMHARTSAFVLCLPCTHALSSLCAVLCAWTHLDAGKMCVSLLYYALTPPPHFHCPFLPAFCAAFNAYLCRHNCTWRHTRFASSNRTLRAL